jgi:outer membrane protein TolC
VDVDAPASGVAFTLEQIVNRSLTANRGLLDARDNLSSTHYSLVAARSSFELKVFPLASATASGGSVNEGAGIGLGVELRKLFETGTQVSVSPTVDRIDGDYTSGIGASIRQPLLRGRQSEFVRSGVDGAEFSARTSRRAVYQTGVATVLGSIRAAYQVVRQREFLRLSEDSMRRLDGHADAARARERAGLASSIDVFRATLQNNQAREGLDAAREAYGDALDTLRIQLSLSLTAPIEVDAPLQFELVRMDEEEAVAIALENRVELVQAKDTLAESRRRSRLAEYDIQPDLDLSLSYARFDTASDFSRSLEFGQDSISVNLLTTSDMARTAERARYQQSLLNVSAAARNLELERDQVIRDVRGALRELQREEKRITLQEDQIRQAQGKLELAQVKFNRGLANNFDVIEAEAELRTAESNLVSAVSTYIVGTYGLRAALGTLLEKPPGI